MNFRLAIAQLICKALASDDVDSVYAAIETPPSTDMGDFAFPCFKLSKELRKAPPLIAKDLCAKIEQPTFVSEIKTAAAYVNFFLTKDIFVGDVIGQVLAQKENYGRSNIGGGANVTIDYSSPNIAKPFHVGHLRTTVIGQALYNMYGFVGYHPIGINHLGDWGTQFGKMIVAFKKWGNLAEVEEKGIPELNRLYVQFHAAAKEDPALDDEARSWLMKMQTGDAEALSLWKWMVDLSLIEFNRVYDLLGVHFDHFTGESFYNDKMDAVVDEMRAKNLLVESEGAMIVDLEPYNMPPCLILRRDGGTLYPTRDIAAAMYRKKTYDSVKSLYVVAVDQSLHFQQFFKVIELMGYEWAKDLCHVPFGLVSLDTGKLSTREGNVILMEDLLADAVKLTAAIIEEKNPSLPNKAEVAKQVGIGAVVFNDLYNSRIKDVVFSWERVLSFDGETGPYVQYTHARACSVLEKASFALDQSTLTAVDYTLLADEASFEVAKLLYAYGGKVVEGVQKNEPSILTRYLVDLAQAFNKFYHDNSVVASEAALKNARLAMVYAVKTVLCSGLGLLGIATPSKM